MAKNYFGENAAKKLMSLVKTDLATKVAAADIANNLTTDDATKVLSAAQGKAVKDALDAYKTANNAEIADMKDGTTAIGNASKLGGQLPAYYASAESVTTGLAAKIDSTKIGAASGVASLGEDGLVPSSQLPSYVDDVIEGYKADDGKFYKEEAHTTEITGEAGKIYVDLATNMSYRWSGSTYVLITSADMVEVTDTKVAELWAAASANPVE